MERGDPPTEDKGLEKKGLIKIPSYEEVFGSSGGRGGSSSSHPYNPPASFSEAFSFIKASEFYTPPPQPPASATAPPQEGTPRRDPESEASSSVVSHCPSSYPSSGSASASSNYLSVNASAQHRNAILVSHRQKGNPLLKHIRNVRWAFADVVCDYLLGQGSCALYLSLRYHLLHPDYLYYRIRELQKNFKLRVVLCHIDVEDVIKPLLEVTRTTLLHDCTLLCGWSLEECGRYLETIKVYENKPADSIREQADTDYLSRLTQVLTTVRRVNKTDVVTLGSTFGSLSGIMHASMEDLARCPGIGERKVKRLYDTFHEPFRRVASRPIVSAGEGSFKDTKAGEPQKLDKGDQSVVNEGEVDTSEAGKGSTGDVRSALDAAFSKYSKRVRKHDA
ncbi:DNA excision repair protein ERCC-1 [Apostasia shenzhenica]|uniref:DNA excision repair protein ERCC-1 n=1 Tax=Apostasia shenzhenica TaxID=1088818 RepID=A0A2I0B8S6_9ASPA|nr:DNA excision repair protein ERCC-1 [Apostasia shenzhenica]